MSALISSIDMNESGKRPLKYPGCDWCKQARQDHG